MMQSAEVAAAHREPSVEDTEGDEEAGWERWREMRGEKEKGHRYKDQLDEAAGRRPRGGRGDHKEEAAVKESRRPRLLPEALWSAAMEMQRRSRHSARGHLNMTVKVRYYMWAAEGWEKRGWKGAFEIGSGVGVLYNISWNVQDAAYLTGIRYKATEKYMRKGDVVEMGNVRIVLREDGRGQRWDAREDRDSKGDDEGDGHGGAGKSCDTEHNYTEYYLNHTSKQVQCCWLQK